MRVPSRPVLLARTLPSGAGGNMPIIRMYPPRGAPLTPYSVSPFLRDHSVGPKPIMYWVTFTPNRFAGIM